MIKTRARAHTHTHTHTHTKPQVPPGALNTTPEPYLWSRDLFKHRYGSRDVFEHRYGSRDVLKPSLDPNMWSGDV